MNQNQKDFLIDRAATIGQKLAMKLRDGGIPSQDELSFFDKTVADVAAFEPAHMLRSLSDGLYAAVEAAKVKRSAWLKGRADALKASEARKQAKAAQRQQALNMSAARKIARVEKQKLLAQAISDVRALHVPVTAPVEGTMSSQGVPFVAELPAEWAKPEVVA